MLYIILPVHDRIKNTKTFIDHLLEQSYSNFHLILVDDGSTDGTSKYVSSMLGSRVSILKGKGNWWWGGSLHQGYLWIKKNANISGNDFVLIMNNDTGFEPNFLNTAVGLIQKESRALLTACGYNIETKQLIDKGTNINWDNFQFTAVENESEINCLSTRGLIMSTSSFMEIGGFHPILLPHYLSDYEFTIRAYQKGFKLFTHPSFKLFVDESTTGLSAPEAGHFFQRLKSVISKKYKANPIYHISFILLVSPNKYKNIKMIIVDHILKAKKILSKSTN